MPETPTEQWSGEDFAPYKNSRRSFICPGYASGAEAIVAVYGRFGCKPGSQHPKNPNLFATLDVSARAEDGPTTWIVTVPYAYLTAAQAEGGELEPLLKPTRYRILPSLVQEESDVDAFGNPYTNSAGFPIDPDQRTFNALTIIATRYYPTYSIGHALKYMNMVNANPVDVKTLGKVERGQMKCTFIGLTEEVTLMKPVPLEVEHHFEIRGPLVSGVATDPGFRRRVLDAGRQGWYKDASGKYQPEDFSAPDPSKGTSYYKTKSAPTLLNGAGVPRDAEVRLGEGSNPKTPVYPSTAYELPLTVERKQMKGGGPVYLYFTNVNEIDFAPLLAGL